MVFVLHPDQDGKEKKASTTGLLKKKARSTHDATSEEENHDKKDKIDKKLQKAEENMVVNSSTHNAEYLAYKRWIKNPKRFPAILATKLNSEEGRSILFKDWVTHNGNVQDIVAKHKHELEESQKSEVKYGFRSEKWLVDNHGEEKAKKIIKKKTAMGLLITDPEDEDDSLYFVLVSLDISNVNQLRKLTSLECSGSVTDDMLKAFTDQGGVLDPKTLKLGDTSSSTVSKAIEFMGMGSSKGGKKNNKKNGKTGKGGDEEDKNKNANAAEAGRREQT